MKKLLPNPEVTFPDYPAVFAIWGENKKDEAQRVADLILFLKKHRVIEDESQVALLLHSVRLSIAVTTCRRSLIKELPLFAHVQGLFLRMKRYA